MIYTFLMTNGIALSKRVKIWGIVLIVITGLLNFHPPHFLLETHKNVGSTSSILEFALFINVLGALIAAFGIYRNKRWGWYLGIIIACISFILWIIQETVGLPGLPKMWFEPSRIVSLIIEAAFVILAFKQINQKENVKKL